MIYAVGYVVCHIITKCREQCLRSLVRVPVNIGTKSDKIENLLSLILPPPPLSTPTPTPPKD